MTTALGVIEGFFGRDWSWSARVDYADFLAEHGYGFYLYAPKGDHCLRREWQRDWSTEHFRQMQEVREIYRDRGISFGLGLSPYEIYRQPKADSQEALKRKIKALNALEPDILCLLFDDMRGDLPDLAQKQIDLVQIAAQETNASRIILCPTYYSFDPLLEKAFGQRPANYWEDLGRGLDQAIDLFWTGPQVCSEDYPIPHLETVRDMLGRRPFLWDNYPVNDSASLSTKLQLRAYGRDRAALNGHLAGHAVNPMNQPQLSKIPLATLPQAYRQRERYGPEAALRQACHELCGPMLASRLLEDVHRFQDLGLDALSADQVSELKNRYQPHADSPYVQELLDWLSGGYAFDPACLT